ncbi:MAG: helix-turn-helix domain-containing protein [Saprospiraceae bacterium]|nr:helix-turn-helix domain-containing protein [Saprospiraceae bacterium]
MKHISILVPESAVLDSITAPRYLFTAINNFLARAGNPPLFDVHLVGLTREVRLHDGLFSVHPDLLMAETAKTDLVIIPALFGDLPSAIESNKDFVPWIQAQALASKFSIGRRNFERRFKKATNNTPVEYIQRVKIEAAKKGLESSRKNVNEVMYEVGYSDVKAFRSVFKKVTGLSPIEYRNKYRFPHTSRS